jgi:hypothetical protein
MQSLAVRAFAPWIPQDRARAKPVPQRIAGDPATEFPQQPRRTEY